MKRTIVPVSLFALALALAGCASGPEPGASTEAPHGHSSMGVDHGSASPSSEAVVDHNAADATFARMMIPHHQQAVQMSETILAKDGIDAPVVELANKIKAAQGPEIGTMTGWLEAWGEPVESGSMDHSMEGMMSDADMAKLRQAEGDEAAALFLTQMIAHHKGAVQMAQTEVAEGSNPEALALAQKIVQDQEAEIKTMEEMLPAYQ
ncbi:DUF305 domain-containing protein [Zafaria cholistanensis]|uniref:DUF305 domain-containing protein n=1 Tax=Zafaria cholistanensis TaxID=1682741 RepID=A0A5A7NQK2_9MICC|nr:DUF305 domain-containing protein [Zafaria cholistanensis]GER23133.1 DUF305 domain-containing protein [Zafaria cholistanensis]